MQITYTQESLKNNAKNIDNKETLSRWTLIAFKDGQFYILARVRWYMGRASSASVVYCNLWLTSYALYKATDWTNCSGTGKAGGGGYCKISASFSDALNSAGIKASEAIFGRGERAIEDCLNAIGEQSGFDHFHLVRG